MANGHLLIDDRPNISGNYGNSLLKYKVLSLVYV
jgi:hypothetical protein